MTILGRGLTGIPAETDSLLIGVGGVVDELLVGTLNQVLTITGSGVDWADVPTDSVQSVNSLTGVVVLDLININDVDLPSPTNGQVLTFNSGTTNWEAQTPIGGDLLAANNLSDVASAQTSINNLTNNVGVITTVDQICFRDHGGNSLEWCIEEDSDATTNLLKMKYNSAERFTFSQTGTAIIKSRNALSEVGTGTDMIVTAGAGKSAAIGGVATLLGGAGAFTGSGGAAKVQGGAANVSGNGGDVLIIPGAQSGGGANGNVIIGLGIEALTWPAADGTVGQVIQTDGSGNLSFANNIGGGGLNNIVEDTTPQLGGNLDVGSFSLTTGGEVVLSFASGGETAVNWVDIKSAITGVGPIVSVKGSDLNIDLVLDTKGTGDIDVSTNKIVNVVDPTTDQDAATKKYVDDQISPLVSQSIDDLSDVTITTPADNEVLTFDFGSGFWKNAPVGGGGAVDSVVLRYNFGVGGGTLTADGGNILPSGWSEVLAVVSGDTHSITYTHAEGHPPTSIGYWGSSVAGGVAPYKFTAPAVDSALFPVEAGVFATEFKLTVDASNMGVLVGIPGGHFYVILTF